MPESMSSFEVSILHARLAKQQSLAGFAWRRLWIAAMHTVLES